MRVCKALQVLKTAPEIFDTSGMSGKLESSFFRTWRDRQTMLICEGNVEQTNTGLMRTLFHSAVAKQAVGVFLRIFDLRSSPVATSLRTRHLSNILVAMVPAFFVCLLCSYCGRQTIFIIEFAELTYALT